MFSGDGRQKWSSRHYVNIGYPHIPVAPFGVKSLTAANYTHSVKLTV